ncbi:hypothetical protein EVAR_87784_1 [Eumeta japonica]|uniref:Uncharacterized protein n=1 Tax=Eumeta variegata TaxID=151549 RepID=A0A4C1X388_EUMVA|nr:hypothetical protein EVAR_87784_1 [Eumeta japonica]
MQRERIAQSHSIHRESDGRARARDSVQSKPADRARTSPVHRPRETRTPPQTRPPETHGESPPRCRVRCSCSHCSVRKLLCGLREKNLTAPTWNTGREKGVGASIPRESPRDESGATSLKTIISRSRLECRPRGPRASPRPRAAGHTARAGDFHRVLSPLFKDRMSRTEAGAGRRNLARRRPPPIETRLSPAEAPRAPARRGAGRWP